MTFRGAFRNFFGSFTWPKQWNERMAEKGYIYAILDKPENRLWFVVGHLKYLWSDLREALALKIAPWLEDGLR